MKRTKVFAAFVSSVMLTLKGIGLAALMLTLVATASASSSQDQDETNNGGRFCTATTKAQFKACGHEKLDDFYGARALCINISDDVARTECFDTARQELEEGKLLCRDQRAQRLDICNELGEFATSEASIRLTSRATITTS